MSIRRGFIVAGSIVALVIATSHAGAAEDAAQLSVAWTSPADGATVRGLATLAAEVAEQQAVRVEFYDGADLIGTALTSPYRIGWDTRAGSDGVHGLTAKAFDDAGHVATATVSVTVDNTPPVVTITTPANGSSLQGVVPIAVQVADANRLRLVVLRVGRRRIARFRRPPYEASWDTRNLPDRPYRIDAIAIDAAGNRGRSMVRVVVSNGAPTPHEEEPEDTPTARATPPAPATATATATGTSTAIATETRRPAPTRTFTRPATPTRTRTMTPTRSATRAGHRRAPRLLRRRERRHAPPPRRAPDHDPRARHARCDTDPHHDYRADAQRDTRRHPDANGHRRADTYGHPHADPHAGDVSDANEDRDAGRRQHRRDEARPHHPDELRARHALHGLRLLLLLRAAAVQLDLGAGHQNGEDRSQGERQRRRRRLRQRRPPDRAAGHAGERPHRQHRRRRPGHRGEGAPPLLARGPAHAGRADDGAGRRLPELRPDDRRRRSERTHPEHALRGPEADLLVLLLRSRQGNRRRRQPERSAGDRRQLRQRRLPASLHLSGRGRDDPQPDDRRRAAAPLRARHPHRRRYRSGRARPVVEVQSRRHAEGAPLPHLYRQDGHRRLHRLPDHALRRLPHPARQRRAARQRAHRAHQPGYLGGARAAAHAVSRRHRPDVARSDRVGHPAVRAHDRAGRRPAEPAGARLERRAADLLRQRPHRHPQLRALPRQHARQRPARPRRPALRRGRRRPGRHPDPGGERVRLLAQHGRPLRLVRARQVVRHLHARHPRRQARHRLPEELRPEQHGADVVPVAPRPADRDLPGLPRRQRDRRAAVEEDLRDPRARPRLPLHRAVGRHQRSRRRRRPARSRPHRGDPQRPPGSQPRLRRSGPHRLLPGLPSRPPLGRPAGQLPDHARTA